MEHMAGGWSVSTREYHLLRLRFPAAVFSYNYVIASFLESKKL